MLQKLKVLRAAAALHQFTVEEVAAYAAVPAPTVRTVLRRHADWFPEVGSEPTGRRGGKWTVYEASDEAAENVAQLIEEHRRATGNVLDPPAGMPASATTEQRLGAIEHALLRVPAPRDGERPHRMERLHDDVQALRAAVESSHDSRLALRYSAIQRLVETLRQDWADTAADEVEQLAQRWTELLRILDEAGLTPVVNLLVDRLRATPLGSMVRARSSSRPRSPSGTTSQPGHDDGRPCAIGVEIRPYKFVAVRVDARGRLVAEHAADVADMRAGTVLRAVAEAVTVLTAGLSTDEVAVGVQLGSPVDTERGIVHFYKKTMLRPTDRPDEFEWQPFEWKDHELGPQLEDLTGLRTVVENDANAFAVREQWFGVGRTAPTFVLVLMREGIGGSVMMNGELFPGPVEIGHFITSKGGLIESETGERGVLETAAGVTGILGAANLSAHEAEREAAIRRGERPTPELVNRLGDLASVVERADESTPAGDGAAKAFTGAGQGIACAIGYLVNFAAPSHVVLCVPPSMWQPQRRATQNFRKEVDDFRRFVPFEPYRKCRLKPRPIRPNDGAQAAALVALERCFGLQPALDVVRTAELAR